MGKSLVLEVFSHNPKYWTNYNFDLMIVLNEKWNKYSPDLALHSCDTVSLTIQFLKKSTPPDFFSFSNL